MSRPSNLMRTLSNLMVGPESELDVSALVIGRVAAIIAAILALRGNETIYAYGTSIGRKEALEKFVREV
ncbi:MAG TPA: hypothetical protein VJW94_04390 [Candidatus Acidoferrum sp.]|nr:hypothetical protein [Candidatus Acidoferrum sp.]